MKAKNIDDIYELTPLQQGLVFHSLFAPGSGVYIEQLSFTLNGKLDVEFFWRAWKTVIERHPILRTMIYVQEIDKPLQMVCKQVELPFEELDWREMSVEKQEQHYKSFLDEDRLRGFDLTKPPLMRLTLIQLNAKAYRFAWRFPHVIMDGWSFGLALQEFITLYKSYCKGQTVDLLPVRPYKDYVAWWKCQDTSESEVFWRNYLQGIALPEALQIGGATNLNDKITHHSEEMWLNDIADELRFLGRQEHLTMNTIFQAAWMIVLSRYLGKDDVLVGSTIAHQPADLINVISESMMGPMLVTLPVRAQLKPNEPLLSWLQQFQMQLAAVRKHTNVSLVQIQEWSGLSQSSHLFESTVAFENVPVPENTLLQDEGIENIDVVYDGRPHYPLTLVIFPGNDLRVRLIYERRRFSQSAVSRLLGNLKQVLVGIVKNPHQPIKEIDLLTSQERHQLLEEWNQVELQSVDCCLHESFEQQVARTPDSIAVVFESQSLTYRELDEKSNQLAHRLQRLGIGVEDRVGLCVERSFNIVIGILGILKAGAAYVPLDPIYPRDRLTFMYDDSGASILLTESSMSEKIPQKNCQIICFNRDESDIANESIEKINNGISPKSLAYIIYTSGSTGCPKGTLVTHANVVRLMSSTKKYFDFNEKDVWPLFHSYAFDVSVWEMWGALLNGGRLVIVPYWVSRSPEKFYELLSQHQITVLNQTPTAFKQLIPVDLELQTSNSLALKYIIFAGEQLDILCLKPWIESHGDEHPRLINMYGITETTVHVTYKRIRAKDISSGAKNIIGKALPDLKVYLVDNYLRLVPIGVEGEICVAGDGVARGYLNQPDLTAQRFILNPFVNNESSEPAYRSGDLAFYHENGELEFCGRADHQVKIRGFRLELGEIEAVLCGYPGIRMAVVTVREDILDDKRLVAYFVNQEATVTISELREFMRKQLPDYMIPAAILQVDEILLTPNGKIDRVSLPCPTDIFTDELQYVTPVTVTEKYLVEILEDLLNIPKIGVQDNLLDMGLHSLLATRVVARIRKNLKTDIPLRAIFETPTVEALAQLIDGGEQPEITSNPIDLKAEVSLDLSIQSSSTWKWKLDPENIFLTGATGFLGGFLLEQLLKSSSANIFCLVRCKNIEEGKRKLRDNLVGFGIWDDCFENRILPVIGDLSKPLLGMSYEMFETLAKKVEEVYHCGALVSFLYPYTQLKPSNVLGTQEVLRLISTGKVKPLHYISTVGVTGLTQEGSVMEMDLTLDPPNILLSGYAQSKWVAERMVTLARSRGLPVAIYRPGRVTGHSKTGAWKTDDAVCQALKTFAYTQKAPNIDVTFDMVPVDYVSSAIVLLARQQDSLGHVFHISNPQTVSSRDLVNSLTLSGFNISLVSFEEWDTTLRMLASDNPEQDFVTTHSLFINWVERQILGQHDPYFDCSNTIAFLKDKLSCPIIDEKLLQKYLSYLIQIGYIPIKNTSQ